MTQARKAILQRLRAGDWSGANKAPLQRDRASGPRPKLASDPMTHFQDKLKANVISFDEVGDASGIVASCMAFLQSHELPLQLCLAPHPLLLDLSWPETVAARPGHVMNDDLTTVSVATAAIAETGSVVMSSSEQTPTEANFLPDNFICIVKRSGLLAHMEELWEIQRQQSDQPPAVTNIISGPSRTADVEQTIQLGAHGPRRMHVIIIE